MTRYWQYPEGCVVRGERPPAPWRQVVVIPLADLPDAKTLRALAIDPRYRYSLRTLADAVEAATTPPKPPEPTGLGAVVETVEGRRFVRLMDDTDFPWALSDQRDNNTNRWHWEHAGGLDGDHPVRVLSEGVTP